MQLAMLRGTGWMTHSLLALGLIGALALPLPAAAQGPDKAVLEAILRNPNLGLLPGEREAAADAAMDNQAEVARHAYHNKDWQKARALGQQTCDANRVIGCVVIGLVLAEGRAGPVDRRGAEVAHRKAAALYAQRCDSSQRSAEHCEEAHKFMLSWAIDGVKDAGLARTYASRARDSAARSCESGGFNCEVAARFTQGDLTGRADPVAALRFWRLGCENPEDPSPYACNQLVNQLVSGPAEVRNPAEARRRILGSQCSAADPARKEGRLALREFCAVLGELMLDGAGGPVDAVKGEQLLRVACGNGLATACTALTTRGLGNDDTKNARALRDIGNPTAARKLFETRCAANVAEACLEAGLLWNPSAGSNTDEARRFFGRACTLGEVKGCFNSGRDLRRLGGADNLQAARAALAKSCEAKIAPGCGLYGVMLANGEGGAVDRPASLQAYETGCAGRDAISCFNLGNALLNGNGIAADPARARPLLEQACELGNMAGCANLGFALATGRGGAEDLVRARSLYQRACDGNNAIGCGNLAFAMREGRGGPTDPVASRKFYEKGCKLNNASACNGYADSLLSSLGGPPDLKKAINTRQESCIVLNNQDACKWLADGGHSDPLYEGDAWVRAGKREPAVAAFQRACNAGTGKACTNVGAYMLVPEGDAAKVRERRGWIQKGCELGEKAACDWLASNK